LLQDCVDHSEIIELSVFSDYRRRGIASKLLEQALVELPENLSKNSNFEGFENGLIGNDSQKAHEKHNEQRRILLEVAENNYPAIALYEKYAFQQIGRRAKYYGSTDALVMERDICERADE
jgi:ribosomal protein S18 acetylase RimI-like enzyme